MRGWLEILATLAYGVASAWIPVLNSEVFLAAGLAARLAHPAWLVTALSTGLALGKGSMFWAVRAGKRIPAIERWRERSATTPREGWAATWRAWVARAVAWVEDPRWGLGMIALSAATGVPPLYATTLAAGTTRMNLWGFTLACWVGLAIRYGVLAAIGLGIFG